MTEKHEVCPVDDLPPGERKIVEIDGKSIGVFNVDDRFYAIKNACPHQGANLCEGTVTGRVCSSSVGQYEFRRDGYIIRCPWHKWEFDIETGRALFDPERWVSATYETATEPASAVDSGGATDPTDDDRSAEEQLSVDRYSVSVEQEIVVVYV